MNQNYTVARKRNFGGFTELSKDLNQSFGDRSGRSVSMRAAHGFKRTFNFSDYEMHDNAAEDIVHGGMLVTGALLSSKNDGAKVGGLFLLFALFLCYQNGK